VNDRPTPSERQWTTDCLVELALDWLARPLGGQTVAQRAEAIDEICLLLSQMRHRDPSRMSLERERWIERVTVRLCRQSGALREHDAGVQAELQRRVMQALLAYHTWREQMAPVVRSMERAGPSDGGEVVA
jgi:hypothetical protein